MRDMTAICRHHNQKAHWNRSKDKALAELQMELQRITDGGIE
jgi:hypothetical protein